MERVGGQGGKLRSATASFCLPFSFFTQLLPEVIKDNDKFKLVLSLDAPCPSLLLLYSDVSATTEEAQLSNSKQVSFLMRT